MNYLFLVCIIYWFIYLFDYLLFGPAVCCDRSDHIYRGQMWRTVFDHFKSVHVFYFSLMLFLILSNIYATYNKRLVNRVVACVYGGCGVG